MFVFMTLYEQHPWNIMNIGGGGGGGGGGGCGGGGGGG